MPLPPQKPASSWGNRPRYGEYDVAGAREGKPRLLGEGSFGKTFEGVRNDTIAGSVIQDFVAIKVLSPDLLNTEPKRVQFIQELVALTRFKHSNLIHYIRCGEEQGEVWYAMELCRGGDLSGMVGRYGPLPERVAAVIGLQVANGLKEVHQRHRLVHRDIKPSNIMLVDELEKELSPQHLAYRFEQQESLCRIVDFGLVDFMLNGQEVRQRFVGSPMYASPEQIREQPVDGRADLYSLGMTLWFLVQGKGPLLDANGAELNDMGKAMGRHADDAPFDDEFPQHLSPEFKSILSRMVAKRPEQRFAHAGELQSALRDYLAATVSGPAVPATAAPAARLTRIEGSVDTLYRIESALPPRAGQKAYLAVEKKSGNRVRLTAVASLGGGEDAAAIDALAEKLCGLAETTGKPGLPAGLLPVRAVILADDFLGYVEDYPAHVTLADLLRARAAAKRPLGFTEAYLILRPLAEALDFLLRNGRECVPLPCEDVWLTSPSLGATPADDALTRPLGEWESMCPVFGTMYLPPAETGGLGGTGYSSQQTMSSSMQMSESDTHPVPAFVRLVYRVLNGSEVAAAVQFTPNAYVPAVTLGAVSNNLIRDILSSQRPWTTVCPVLKELCDEEGVIWRGGASTVSATRTVGSAGATRTSASMTHAPSPHRSIASQSPAQTGPSATVASSIARASRAAQTHAPAFPTTPPPAASRFSSPPPPPPLPVPEPAKWIGVGVAALLIAGVAVFLFSGKKPVPPGIVASPSGQSTPAAQSTPGAVEPARTPEPARSVALPEYAMVQLLDEFSKQPTFKVGSRPVIPTPQGSNWRVPIREIAPTLPFTITVEAIGFEPIELPIASVDDLAKPLSASAQRAKGKITFTGIPAEYTNVSLRMIEALGDEKGAVPVPSSGIGSELKGGGAVSRELPTGIYRVLFKKDRLMDRWPTVVPIKHNGAETLPFPPLVNGDYAGQAGSGGALELHFVSRGTGGWIRLAGKQRDLADVRLDADNVAYLARALASASGDAPEGTIKVQYTGGDSFDVWTTSGDSSDSRDFSLLGTVKQTSAAP